MNKNSGRIGLGFPIIALMTFYMMSVSCGTVAPDIGENECPEPEDPTIVATVSATTNNGSKHGSSAISGYTGQVFEPNNAFKGDIARMYSYFATRYED